MLTIKLDTGLQFFFSAYFKYLYHIDRIFYFIDLKRDPVQLHDYYKKQWSKLKLPGDESQSTKNLRWAVREWMMGKRPPE